MKKILMIDDDTNILKAASYYLDNEFEVITTDNPCNGLKIINSEKIDCVVVDYQMEGMNGIDVTNVIRKNPAIANIPIIIMTGHSDVELIDLAFHNGVSDFIVKPINLEVLKNRIKQAVAHATLKGIF